MKKLREQIKYIDYEIGKYETAFKINKKKLSEGDNTVVIVLALLHDTLLHLKSIRTSLTTLKLAEDDGNN